MAQKLLIGAAPPDGGSRRKNLCDGGLKIEKPPRGGQWHYSHFAGCCQEIGGFACNEPNAGERAQVGENSKKQIG